MAVVVRWEAWEDGTWLPRMKAFSGWDAVPGWLDHEHLREGRQSGAVAGGVRNVTVVDESAPAGGAAGRIVAA